MLTASGDFLQNGLALDRQQEHLAPDTSAKEEWDLESLRQKDVLSNSPPKPAAPDANNSLRLETDTIIVRGFSTDHISSLRTSHAQLATTSVLCAERTRKNVATFVLGGSPGRDGDVRDGASSLESRFLGGRGSRSEGLRKYAGKKTTPFKEEVAKVTIQAYNSDNVPEDTDEEEKDRSEIAVEDDDVDKWGDDNKASSAPPFNEKEMFRRIDSTPNLHSRCSMLTRMHDKDRAAALRNATSRSSRTIRPSRTRPSPPINIPPGDLKPFKTHSLALSPCTTRRNMLSCELSESLRIGILWERGDKKSTINALSNTASNESQPTSLLAPTKHPRNQKSCSSHFDYDLVGLLEYHQKGW